MGSSDRVSPATASRASTPALELQRAERVEVLSVVERAGRDARAPRGFLVEASSGTLFLDALAEMSPSLQAKLLDVIGELDPPRNEG